MKTELIHKFAHNDDSFLTYYSLEEDNENTTTDIAILICPGGGYEHISTRESKPVANAFLKRGYKVFILNYSILENAKDLTPLSEIEFAIKHIRTNANRYCIDPNKVVALGFSAGGHLALSSGTLLQPEYRPNGLVLCYPVVTATCKTHLGSLHYFCGTDTPSDEQIKQFSLDLHVDANTPPVFVWHTVTDESVPIQNTYNLVEALKHNGINYELHVFPYGEHGLALATHETCENIKENEVHPASAWVDLTDKWIKANLT